MAQAATWDWDLEANLLLWSDNMFRLLGLEPGAITPTPEYVIEQTHPDDRPRVEAEIEAARRQGSPPDVTYRIVLPDGRIRVLRGATTAVAEMSDGRPTRLIGSVQDLTDTVEAERKLAESLTLMEAMQSGAPVGFAFVDTDFRIVQMNQMLAEVNGSPAEEQVGKTIAELVPDVWEQMQPVYERVLISGEPEVNLEVERERRTTGELRSWLSSYYPVRVEQEVIGVGVIVVDITDRTEAEHFRAAVMDTIVEGLYVLDKNGRLKFMNPAAAKMLGWSEEELRGESVHEAIHYQHADGSPHPEEECELLKVRTELRAVQMMQEAFTAKDGTIVPVSYSAAPLMRGTALDGVVVVFRDRTEEQAKETQAKRELDTLAWVGRIRDAFDQDRMTLYSQPIVPLTGGRPSQELLLRMLGAGGEVILPGSFLPVAERYGLIDEIDRWVIGQAARRAGSGSRVEANLSARSVGDFDLLPLIERELQAAGADPADLVFEITETALMDNAEAGEAFAQGLSKIGCQIALDDFGTGFGSFTYLKTLPITYLKIDVDFVRDLASSEANQHLVRAIVGLAGDFGYQTIAEGVEDAEALGILKEFGVDFVQGYFLGAPAPVT
ncbi:MAG TPA: EAL domain-containing protein [Solirubrobacterales bacterium]|nr:EAL domain-containing protein [Solirubrobacterales bacterium]